MLPQKNRLVAWLAGVTIFVLSSGALAEVTMLAPEKGVRMERGSKRQIVRWQYADDRAETRFSILVEVFRGLPPDETERVSAREYVAKKTASGDFVTAISIPDTPPGKHWLRIADAERPSDSRRAGESAVFRIVDPRRDLEIGEVKNVDGILHATVYSRRASFDGNLLFRIQQGPHAVPQTRLVRVHIEPTGAGDYLPPGELVSLGIPVEPPAITLGDPCGLTYFVDLDPDGNVPETNRANNRWEGEVFFREYAAQLVEPVLFGIYGGVYVPDSRQVVVQIPRYLYGETDTYPLVLSFSVRNCGYKPLPTNWRVMLWQHYRRVDPKHPLENMDAIRNIQPDFLPRFPIEPGETYPFFSRYDYLPVNGRIQLRTANPPEMGGAFGIDYSFQVRFVVRR